MSLLPSRGRCHAVFLLAHSARLSEFENPEKWIDNANERLTLMASSLDLRGPAKWLVERELVTTAPVVKLSKELEKLSFEANETTLVAIASLLLRHAPPPWLKMSVIDHGFHPSLVPTDDLVDLSWLGDELEPIIIGVLNQLQPPSDDLLRKQLGDAGEQIVVSALEREMLKPQHVALISDSYGFDIRYYQGGTEWKVEVKTCVPATRSKFYLSRNEFHTACRHPNSWKLVQVNLSSSTLINRRIKKQDILQIRELLAPKLISLAPKTSNEFDWIDTALFCPNAECWGDSDLHVAEGFVLEFDS